MAPPKSGYQDIMESSEHSGELGEQLWLHNGTASEALYLHGKFPSIELHAEQSECSLERESKTL